MIVAAVLIVGGVGLTFAILIAFADRKLRVWEDPRIDTVASMLPNNNCGACGLPGCRAFAEQAVAGTVKAAQCSVMSPDGVVAVAAYLGVDAGTAIKRVARLACAGGTDVSRRDAEYRGLETCAAAHAVSGGGKACAWGCLGLADCKVVCTFDAIVMNAFGLPVVDTVKCTACGDCVEACPKDLFSILPLDSKLFVQCCNLVGDDSVTSVCSVACTACGKCVQDAVPGLISVVTGVAVVDYQLIDQATEAAVSRCPTSAIVWIHGAQFAHNTSNNTSNSNRQLESVLS
jgi:Na+-translocating ferredoxin:NAD+ oxidoreductase RNF subunit RnfB